MSCYLCIISELSLFMLPISSYNGFSVFILSFLCMSFVVYFTKVYNIIYKYMNKKGNFTINVFVNFRFILFKGSCQNQDQRTQQNILACQQLHPAKSYIYLILNVNSFMAYWRGVINKELYTRDVTPDKSVCILSKYMYSIVFGLHW